jgi:hypothetical protein
MITVNLGAFSRGPVTAIRAVNVLVLSRNLNMRVIIAE